MAITIIADPQILTPAYNPMYFYLDSTSKTQLGYRYLIEVVDNDTTEVIGTYRLKPIPTTLYGEVDISKLIQTRLEEDFQQLTGYIADKQQISYKLNIDEEYFVNTAFTDYGFAGSVSWANFGTATINPSGFTRTMLIHGAVLPVWTAGDIILVTQTPGANYRAELEGVHTVLDVFLSAGVYYTVLDLLWIGSGAASPGNATYADGQKTVIAGIVSGNYTAFKGAIGFMTFKDYDHTTYILDGVTKKLLTTLPTDVRISRNKPTYLSGYLDNAASHYVEFNIAGTVYRYGLTGMAENVVLFDALPTTATIEQVFTAGWVAFVGTIDLTNIETYTIQIATSTSTDKSEIRTITLYNECDHHTIYDICFMDRLGSWITIPFYKGSYMSQDVQREKIRTKYGAYDTGNWVYNATDTGSKSYHIEEQISYTVNTGILSEVECQYMRELLSTPQAYVSIDGGDFQAIEIISASMPLHLKRTTRDRKVNLVFTMSVQDEING